MLQLWSPPVILFCFNYFPVELTVRPFKTYWVLLITPPPPPPPSLIKRFLIQFSTCQHDVLQMLSEENLSKS